MTHSDRGRFRSSLAAALLPPWPGQPLGRLGGSLLNPHYVGSFLLLAVVSILAGVVLLGLRVSVAKAIPGESTHGRSWRAIVSQPIYLVALFGAVTGYGVMILAMTATPLAMSHYHHELADASIVIQFHVLGMFRPPFLRAF